MEQFVTESPEKMPSMSVSVFDKEKKLKTYYCTPRGFQLERYIHSLYPTARIEMKFMKNSGLKYPPFKVKVFINEEHYETHIGHYDMH